MKKHLVLVTDGEYKTIISGKREFIVRFFKKRPEFLSEVGLGDLIYFRKRGDEALGQFVIGKLIVIEGAVSNDWDLLKNQFNFEEKLGINNIILIVQITKLEQFIASPIEMPYNLRKDWVILKDL